MYLVFDTETTGLPKNFSKPIDDFDNWSTARCVQLAWQLHDSRGALIESGNDLIKPEGFEIPLESTAIHKISHQLALENGISIVNALSKFSQVLSQASYIIGHNINFDINILGSEYLRIGHASPFLNAKHIDTMKSTVEFCKLTHGEEGLVKSVESNGHWVTRDGIEMYKFKVCVENLNTKLIDEGLIHKKSERAPNLALGEKINYIINNKGTIKIRKGYKSPKLEELYTTLFSDSYLLDYAHNGAADVNATARCFFELLRLNVLSETNCDISKKSINVFIESNSQPIKLWDIDLGLTLHKKKDTSKKNDKISLEFSKDKYLHSSFSPQSILCHVRCHTSYSILQSTISVQQLISKAKSVNMPAIAITDHGNLFGAFDFISLCNKNHILPMLGCEFYMVEDRKVRKFTVQNKDKRYSQVLYAKNKTGYQNLCKISSYGYIDGLYSGFARIDKSLIKEYKKDLIATTSGLYGEISQLIISGNTKKAKEEFLWWLNEFKDDFFIEISRNNIKFEQEVNEVLLSWAKEYSVKYIPANRVYYLEKNDAKAHDALLCVKNGSMISTPKGRGHGKRFGFENNNFYFHEQEEMYALFSDLEYALDNLTYFTQKFDTYQLEQDVILPKYDLPDGFVDQSKYLRYLCQIGAKNKYGDIKSSIANRIEYELQTIEKTGYPGYFLIVQDIIKNAKKMGISVGPGRGSVGGSVVAYCLDITTVDPIKYDLLFERFLNPERVSMPDIDIDFDDVGRSKLIAWVLDKYGKNQVAQIITYGKMAAKSSIRDMGRVLNIPLNQVDVLAKKIPNISLSQIFSNSNKELSALLNREDLNTVRELMDSLNQNKEEKQLMDLACLNEGSIRNLGLHACGVIITPDDITNYIPVCKNSDSDLLITQFDNSVVERAGMLKMDFLGLNTLSQIKDAIRIIEKRHDVSIDIDNVNIEDKKTFELYQKGETLGTFQFESAGMQKHLRALKPDQFEDLIAMNALYRPGPMEYIPNFIERKHGREKINYDLPIMEKILGNTYGITVYQEQVMKLSQELAGFSEGKADILRKAMGKKKKNILDGLKEEFFKGCETRNHDLKKVEKIWKDWEAFASYAFNKSHSTCYSFISFQTAYLKAHYPEEFMASVLTHNMRDLAKLTPYLDECKRMEISVLGPDLNESYINYSVNKNNAIRFGLGAIKGVGSIAAASIIQERKKNGPYRSFMDFIKRIEGKVVNKRVLEALAIGGAFDTLVSVNRANFFTEIDNKTFIELVIQFRSQLSKSQDSLNQLEMFDQSTLSNLTQEPVLSDSEQWGKLKLLDKEKEVLGIYISGHPLDDYILEVKNFCTHQIRDIDLFNAPIHNFTFSSYVKSHIERMGKNNKPYGIISLEDYSGTQELRLFGDNYISFKNYFIEGALLYFSASMIKRSWDGSLMLKLNKVHLLSDVSSKLIREIQFKLSSETLDQSIIDKILIIFKKHPGHHNVKFTVFNQDFHLDFLSKKYKINICSELVSEMAEISNQYKLN